MKVLVEIPDEDSEWLVTYAFKRGYMRDEPRKRITPLERKKIVRWALEHLAKTVVPEQ